MKKSLLCLLAILVGYVAYRIWPVPEPLPVLGKMPAFALTDIQGRKVDNASMLGKVWAISFFFSSCPKTCPAINAKLRSLAKKNPSLNLLSVSVDPERDSIEALQKYATKLDLPLDKWHLITIPRAESAKFAEDIMLYIGDSADAHNTRVLYADHFGLIRGGLSGLDPDFEDESQIIIDRIIQEHR